jgi:DNA-binding XRE family transcriptional regulator
VVKSQDFLTEVIAERAGHNPGFPNLVGAVLRRRELLRELGARRQQLGLSQTAVAALMGTSQSAVARLETGDVDVKLSTLERYAAALDQQVEWQIVKAGR